MSDRLAVFNQGRIEQVGTPAEVYERPAHGVRRRLRRRLEPGARRAGPEAQRARRAPSSIRPEKIRLLAGGRRRRRRLRVDGRIRGVRSTSACTPATLVELDGGGDADGGRAEPRHHLDGGGPRAAGRAAGLAAAPRGAGARRAEA